MGASQYDVLVLGGGCAGMSAAIGLARAGFRVAVVEAAPFPGAENWSGCVYFAENLAHPSLLGPEGVEELAWERRLVERGFFLCDGFHVLGFRYRDPEAFRYCYTVLRPILDRHLSLIAAQLGVVVLSSTTAVSLIREGERVIGAATQRGPIYADLTFLAEGDASHLLAREGLERGARPDYKPKFLQGIKQVIELPEGGVEANFGLGPDEAAAYEIVLRNGMLKGQPVHLNMGGFVYANRRSISLGLVLPADNLSRHFQGDPNLLLEWFESLPVVRRWCQGGRRGVFGAKLIRGGGARDIPQLVSTGLVVGGAATAIGTDFPYPNYTGPATRMALLLVEAAKAIRAEGGSFTEAELRRHYLEPLQQTRAWKDVEFLRHWPAYVEKTQWFFGRSVDLALGTASIWSQRRRWNRSRWLDCVRLLVGVAGPGQWASLRQDARALAKGLGWKRIAGIPTLGRFLLYGWLNAFRDLCGVPRVGVPHAGTLRFVYSQGGEPPPARPPWLVRRWLRRFQPVLAAALRHVYANDEEPLESKLRQALSLLARQVNLFDLLVFAALAVAAGATAVLLLAARWCRKVLGYRPEEPLGSLARAYFETARRAADLTGHWAAASASWESRLGELAYEAPAKSHIHVRWPQALDQRLEILSDGLWHICPARVYEARPGPQSQLQIIVNYENCIKCETCWRTSEQVEWGRDGRHRFTYPVSSSATLKVQEAARAAAAVVPASPRTLSPWPAPTDAGVAGSDSSQAAAPAALVRRLQRQLDALARALDQEPRTVDASRQEHLIRLGQHAEAVAHELVLSVQSLPGDRQAAPVVRLAREAAAHAGRLSQLLRQGRYAWAVAEGRLLQQHHLAGLGRFLGSACADEASRSCAESRADIRQTLDEFLPDSVWRTLEPEGTRHKGPAPGLAPHQEERLRELLRSVPPRAKGEGPAHSSRRKALLAELAARDPSLAYRASCHLLARDLLGEEAADQWLSLGIVQDVRPVDGRCSGTAWFVPAADRYCLLLGDRLADLHPHHPALAAQPLATLGLRGARLLRLTLQDLPLDGFPARAELEQQWTILSCADLTAMARGMAEVLEQRSVNHASTRVQFPGLYSDDEGRDNIAKFGAVKKMLAQIAARRLLLEVLERRCSDDATLASSARHWALVKALAAEWLGTAPGSISYNAGQIFGGTGYSEEDILAKFYRDAAAWRYLGPANPSIWRGHAQRLRETGQVSEWAGEIAAFEQIAQRLALLQPLEQLRRVRNRLRSCLADMRAAPDGVLPDQDALALARVDAMQWAAKALLLEVHRRLEDADTADLETALLESWLEEVETAVVDLEQRRDLSRRRIYRIAGSNPGGSGDAPAASDGIARPTSREYDLFLATPLPYETGDFLVKAADLTLPRLVPEMVSADFSLASLDRRFRDLFRERFGQPRDGHAFERWLEERHCPADEDLDFLRQAGCFRFLIPKDLGGEGLRKADYYLMVQNAQREADVAMALTIQVNASLGTTPILLARFRDIPKAKGELAGFVADHALHRELDEGLKLLVSSATVGQVEEGMARLRQRVEKQILAPTAVRVVCHRFVTAWQALARAVREYDLTACRVEARRAWEGWHHACACAPDLLAEMDRRLQACDFFLRRIASGQISAFALTEPSAGSDTARLLSRAVLRSVPVEADQDGVLTFVPHGGHDPKVLLDAQRLEVRPDGLYYRWSDSQAPSRIVIEETADAAGFPTFRRYYLHGTRPVWFSDIAQVRSRGGKLWYDYWELHGSKMWITNGRIMGVVIVYARTEEGVTGFLVDRYAEGLIVGKDERKLGQCGSPTNELSFDAVRVPRENVLGLEGRGQVNALETLNLGRAGIAMSSLASLQTVVQVCRTRPHGPASEAGDLSDPELATLEYLAESVAFDLVGKLEHPQTRSLRMEASIAKLLVTELLHEAIERAEDLLGLPGQTQEHVIEKRKRDARVLTIYEGTNEIQRWLIWTHLVHEVAPRWSSDAAAAGDQPEVLREALDSYLRGRRELGQRLRQAVARFGQHLVHNPSFQASCVALSEAAAWLRAMECVLGRMAWCLRFGYGIPPAAEQALLRCHREVWTRLLGFDGNFERHQRGQYAPAVRAASLLLHKAEEPREAQPVAVSAQVAKPLRVLVVVEYEPVTATQPELSQGRLLDAGWKLSSASEAALELGLRLRDCGQGRLHLEAATLGGAGLVPRLRELLARDIERVTLLECRQEPWLWDAAAARLAEHFASAGRQFDLILAPGGEERSEQGVLGLHVAARWNIPWEAAAPVCHLRHDADGSVLRLGEKGRSWYRSLPLALGVPAGLPLRPFTTEGYLAGLGKPLEIVPGGFDEPRFQAFGSASWTVTAEGDGRAPAEETVPAALTPPKAAEFVLDTLGLDSERLAGAAPLETSIAELPPDCPPWASPGDGHPPAALAILASDPQGRLLEGARAAIGTACSAGRACVLLLVPAQEAAQAAAAAQAAQLGATWIVLWEVPQQALLVPAWKERLVRELLPWADAPWCLLAGEHWLQRVVPLVPRLSGRPGAAVVRVRRAAVLEDEESLLVETRRGRLAVQRRLPLESSWLHAVALLPEAEAPLTPGGRGPVRVFRWRPASSLHSAESLAALLEQVRADSGTAHLSEAEFVIDVGFGVGNRDGYEAVIVPLEAALKSLGVSQLAIGGSRKVTEELRLLPADRQIGQSGVSVRPRILLAIGISGAPQHLSYIDPRATIIAFNRDPEAPIMTWNRRQPRPKVFGVVGDLFETVPAFIAALKSSR
jgi:alkylation response protein AidB-like acyl-CoA dehydrogenase/flavin-dependent dehydrogenase/electron transfer flavoprotein alpha subunit/ferredoxin-like protein FixX